MLILAVLVLAVMLAGFSSQSDAAQSMDGGVKVASYNVLMQRMERPGEDNDHLASSDKWAARKLRIVQEIDEHGYGIVSFQEVGSGRAGRPSPMIKDIREVLPARFQMTTALLLGALLRTWRSAK